MSTEHVSDLSPLIERTKGINKWLTDISPSCFAEQRHLNPESVERVYWHYGYMVALSDALRILTGESPLTEERDSRPRGTNKACFPASPDE